ncbi:adenylyl-sulfate kinase [Demequina capsici]|uniref:Adenylyl-sulfate kinase n=1 Tax=Demequina capsici TaxID=3075620 RepID=A0AA96F6S8_9MICO|nr:adenylyl-sulfate kinase [Demequina sp. OYTSA14]WNM24349.1 adenylyl-sulfate kinase [Demequina sp. OYTSA14]
MTDHRLTALQLHDLELMVAGSLEPVATLPSEPGGMALQVPSADGPVMLLDRESTPVARVDVVATQADDDAWWVAGPVTLLRPLAAFDFARLRPGASQPLSEPATMLIGDTAPLPRGDAPLIVVDTGDARALARAVTRAERAGHPVRVMPEPSAAARAGDGRADVLARLASLAFGVSVELSVSEQSVGDGIVVLLTGLSGSGKSTIAKELAQRLRVESDQHVTLLDGDEVRAVLSTGLGFSHDDRMMNVRRIGWVAALVAEHGGIAISAPIAPYEAMRAEMRERVAKVGRFVLVHVATPLEVCEARDRKGLYAKARAGLIKEFTGISDPYEQPTDADVVITEDLSPAQAADRIIRAMAPRHDLEYQI